VVLSIKLFYHGFVGGFFREQRLFPWPKGCNPEKGLERLFILLPKTPGIESTQIYNEARNLYSPDSFPNDCQKNRPDLAPSINET